MRELFRALADIGAIHQQIGRVDGFRGYGPATMGATGLLAGAVATAQSLRVGSEVPAASYVAIWVVTAAVAVCLVGAEAATRSRRLRWRGWSGRWRERADENVRSASTKSPHRS